MCGPRCPRAGTYERGWSSTSRARSASTGTLCWRSTSIYLSRSRSASGAEESAVPHLDSAGEWEQEVPIHVPEGTGRAFGRVTGDINPIHLHAVPAKAFGFSKAIVPRVVDHRARGGGARCRRGGAGATTGDRLQAPDRAAVHADPLLALRLVRRGGVRPVPRVAGRGRRGARAGAGVGGRDRLSASRGRRRQQDRACPGGQNHRCARR